MADIYSESFWRLFEELDASLDPEGPEQLYAIADSYISPGQHILDVAVATAAI